MKNRKSILLVVLLLAIGFAAVSTTLYINGSTNINPNQNDFNVYYSDAYVNGTQDKSVITDNTHIVFETELSTLGEKYVLDYEVANGSKNYDAELSMTCTSSNDYLNIVNEFDDETILEARSTRNGTLTLELSRSNAGEDLSISIECTISANAIERTSLNESEMQTAAEYIIEGYYKDSNNVVLANKNLVFFSEKPHYVTTDENGYIFYNGLERGKHEVYYVDDTLDNIKTMTKEEIIGNAKTSAIFTTTSDEIVFDDNTTIEDLNIEDNIKYCTSLMNEEWNFSYTGAESSFITRCNGIYKIELWGASGNSINGFESYGAYVAGNLKIEKNNKLYIYVGQMGEQIYDKLNTFNGGGIGNLWCSESTDWNTNMQGGGATDIRLVNGTWNDFASLKSRIMVAAGSGGSTGFAKGGAGGGLIGYSGDADPRVDSNYSGYYATQIAGGEKNGAFGIGGTAEYSGHVCSFNDGAGGGSGYYGGGGSRGNDVKTGGTGAGGSSFISGHTGCDAISSDSTGSNIIHTGQANHYSGYVFTDTKMVDGAGYNWTTVKGEYTGMPSHDGTTIMTGNAGNGYAKITYLGTN